MNITVYCGSAKGSDPAYEEAAVRLGEWIHRNGHGMVYGGGNIGLMGIIADIVLAGGGKVAGIIPEFLIEHEKGHEGLHTLEVVETMSQRKNRMMELGDAFLAMPGGTGTLEEIAEVISLARLGFHEKPCVFYNVNDFYRPMKEMLQAMADADFLPREMLERIRFITEPEELAGILAGGR